MEIVLSILIPSTKDRLEMTEQLLNQLSLQSYKQSVEIITDWHPYNCVGKKRNDLLKKATGSYVVFVDSDDEITSNYIQLTLEACKSGADCIGIQGCITTNGYDKRQWYISKEYGHWHTGPDGIYYRTPNHISPVRRELALQAGFPEISFGEDAEYSRRLLPLLKSETLVTQNIYHYKFRNDK